MMQKDIIVSLSRHIIFFCLLQCVVLLVYIAVRLATFSIAYSVHAVKKMTHKHQVSHALCSA